ncbi:MAG: hypothetical protein IPK97_05950 [Ahniella sp.]|nr:hypothetical protein [Ahniella sp.]
MKCVIRAVLIGFMIVLAAPAGALTLRVGTGTGCTHPDLTSALLAIRTETGTHTIRINKGTYPVPDGMAYLPTVNQTAVFLEGGYADCLAAAPSGNTASDADRAVFDATGGQRRSVLDVHVFGRIGTFQIRRIVLTGGDATDAAPVSDFAKTGGGLMVRGQASVLLGLGTTIRNNAAISGGGVALAGSNIQDVSSARVDLFIDEGAEIRNNVATDRGGGIYCGGQNAAPIFRRPATISAVSCCVMARSASIRQSVVRRSTVVARSKGAGGSSRVRSPIGWRGFSGIRARAAALGVLRDMVPWIPFCRSSRMASGTLVRRWAATVLLQ